MLNEAWKVWFWIAYLLLFVGFCLGAKPKLLDRSSQKAKTIGDTVILSCTFNSSVDFTWLKDGKSVQLSKRIYVSKLKAGVQHALMIEQIQASDDGLYSCVGKNSDGQDSGEIKLDVILNYKPRIRPIKDVYLRDGGSEDVACNSDALPPKVTYKWEKVGGGSITADQNVLKIQNVKDKDTGLYRCTATNSEGSSVETVTISIAKNTKWIEQPTSRSVESPETFAWVASIVTLRPDPVFKWYKDGSFILRESSMTRVGVKYSSRLLFQQPSLADAGNYQVMVENLELSELKTDMVLTVFAPPSVLINEGKEVELKLGDPLNLICNVEANPNPEIKWVHNGTVLSSLPGNGTKVLAYRKDEVTMEDRGEYVCEASNDRGSVNSSVNVVVEKTGLSTAVKITLIVVLCCVIVIILLGCTFFYWKYGETCFKVAFEHTFYTDLVEEEKDLSSLRDLENNPNTIKKNINKSIKNYPVERQEETALGAIRNSIRRSTKKKPPMQHQTSIFDTINAKKNKTLSTSDGHGARLASVDLVNGRNIDLEQLTFDEVIAEGEYGGVTRGNYIMDNDTGVREVSIKMLKEELLKSAEKRNMLTEIRLMRRIKSHVNIVEFIGWSVSPGCVCIVEEHMPFGSLLEYLRAQAALVNVDTTDVEIEDTDAVVNQMVLLSFAQQIAAGMIHLAQLQVVHRDLACRNVYISYENTVKISDYSIVRDVYTPNVYRQTTGGQLPVRWMAYEAIFDGEYTTKADVWSFGVLLWELCTLGDIPYPNLIKTEQLLEELEHGYRMERPGNISTDLFLLMNSCWNKAAAARPTFNKLYTTISDFIYEEEDTAHIDVGAILDTMRTSGSCKVMPSNEGHNIPIPTHSSHALVEEDEEGGEPSERDPIV